MKYSPTVERLNFRNLAAGFTLVEVLFVLLVMGFVSLGLYQFIGGSAKAIYISTEKNDIANNIRQFTGEMEAAAEIANTAYIYNSFNITDRNDPSDRLADGLSGDLAIFVTLEANSNPLNPDLITKIVGYFRLPDAQGHGPVKKFILNYPSGMDSSVYTPEALMTSGLSSTMQYRQVLQLAKGLADGKLFYNFRNKSLMIKAQIVQGLNARKVTNTYNFTVTPRG